MQIGQVLENATQTMLGIIGFENKEIYFSGGLVKKDDFVIFDIVDYVKSLKRAKNVINYQEAINGFSYYHDQLFYKNNQNDHIKDDFEFHYQALIKFEKHGLSPQQFDLTPVQLRKYDKFINYHFSIQNK